MNSISPPSSIQKCSFKTFIGAKHRARLARKDTAVAVTATARELACLNCLMVTQGDEYVEKGTEAYEKRRMNRRFSYLDRQAQRLGYQLVQITPKKKTTQSHQRLRSKLLEREALMVKRNAPRWIRMLRRYGYVEPVDAELKAA